MSDYDGELRFETDAAEAAVHIDNALTELTDIRAYVLSEDEMANFKQAQLALRELYHGFEEYKDDC
jgi:hypothetical protein